MIFFFFNLLLLKQNDFIFFLKCLFVKDNFFSLYVKFCSNLFLFKIENKKADRILLLKQISLEQTGLIDLTDLFNSFSKTIKQTFYSPILAFYNLY